MKKIFYISSFFAILVYTYLYSQDLSSSFKQASTSSFNIPVPQAEVIKTESNNSVSESKENPEWLVLVFVSGANDLGILKFTNEDVNEMERIGSTKNVQVVVEYNSLAQGLDGEVVFQKGGKTIFINKDDKPNEITSYSINSLNSNMGSWKHLSIFARKYIAKFKPKKVMLVVWNHGNGRLGVAYDDVSRNHMEIKDLGKALNEISSYYGKKIDILAFDACLMQMSAVDNEFKNYTDYILASEESIPGPGFPYDDALKVLNSTNDSLMAVKSIAETYYKAYQFSKPGGYNIGPNKTHTISVIDASKIPTFVSSLNDWAESLMNNKEEFEKVTNESFTENVFYYGGMGGIEEAGLRSMDLYDYLNSLYPIISDENIKDKTKKLMNYIKNNLIVFNKAGNGQNFQSLVYSDHSNGLAIYMPLLRYNNTNYEMLSFSAESKWDDFIRKMLGHRGIYGK